MKKLMIIAGLLLFLAGNASAYYGNCGLPPLSPLPPIGTTHCEPICVCDQYGYCHWEFICS